MCVTGKAFELAITLRQQTQMVHFQHEEEGVCLRASEVKPKLDRFIFSLLGGGDSLKKIENGYRQARKWGWTIGEHQSLDYKMKIRAPRGPQPVPNEAHGLYFGGDPSKQAIFYKGLINLTIICFNEELRKKIEETIALFFILHNFGTRQTKGFGSFLVEGEYAASVPFESLKKYYLHVLKRSFIFTKVSPTSDEENLNVAQALYNLLKGGINIPGRVCEKSFLTKTYLNQGIKGEKAFIKGNGYLKSPPKYSQAPSGYQFNRALLGLPKNYEFPDASASINVEDSSRGKNDNKGINRFASPILIKIFGDYVIFLPGLIPDELFGREFCLSNSGVIWKIKTPPNPPFNLPQFFDLSQLLIDFANHFNSSAVKKNLQTNFGSHDFYSQKDKKRYGDWKRKKTGKPYIGGRRISGLVIKKEVAP